MPGVEAGDGAVALSALVAQAQEAPPYGYDEFVRRRGRRAVQRRAAGWVATASFTAVAAVVGLGLWRAAAGPSMAIPGSSSDAPALVQAEREAVLGELEENIAWFDAVLSAGSAEAFSGPEQAELRAAREQLAGSLQRVVYAHALLAD